MSCGTGNTHCCWLGKYGQCLYVIAVNEPPYKWRCGIRREYETWEEAHNDSRYANFIRPKLRDIGILVDCGDWPQAVPGAKCRDCGYGVDGDA